jgi:hypothetical protein
MLQKINELFNLSSFLLWFRSEMLPNGSGVEGFVPNASMFTCRTLGSD